MVVDRTTDRWHLVAKGLRPADRVPVLLGLDEGVREGWWNPNRALWFIVAYNFDINMALPRPVRPWCWRPLPQLPKNIKRPR